MKYEDPQQAIREAKREEEEWRRRIAADPRSSKKKAERVSSLADHMPKQRRKGWATVVATEWLLDQGWQVFKNVCDSEVEKLVGISDGNATLFDVKLCHIIQGPTGALRVSGVRKHVADIEVKTGINLIYVTGDGICAFRPDELVAKHKAYADAM